MTSPILASCSVILGLFLLIGGGELLVQGASRLAKGFGVSAFVVGLTVVAFGTSVPELFISLTASLQGHADIMIGNVIGSNIANVGLILGCCSLVAPLRLQLRDVWNELLIVVGASVFLMFCSGYGFFPRIVGIFFTLAILSHTAFTYLNAKNGRKLDGKDTPSLTRGDTVLLVARIIIGLGLLALGSHMFINGAITLARIIGVSELIIGLTLAAVGTSLPELASSIAALRHRETGMLIGNVIGSNMFNLLMVLGITGVIKPFTIDPSLLTRDLPIMLFFTLILIPMLLRDGTTRKWHGIILLCMYTGYCVSLL
ncbi:calcium/sodium antiporter [Desulfogranum japonicum]|uniref:calcium/sodium antiporter n=1 Tax=Desulfogranum japonicum TaxID=231447 RepID=UPI0004160F3B|nr:calcium/sodium antiporter [Desulfogranum japonicum]